MLLGVVVVYFKLKKLESRGAPPATSNEQPVTTPDDPYLARVRDLVSGDKS
jgi:hypothetical protein